MPTVSTPLRYPGGKSALTDFLAKTIELNGLSNCTYMNRFVVELVLQLIFWPGDAPKD